MLLDTEFAASACLIRITSGATKSLLFLQSAEILSVTLYNPITKVSLSDTALLRLGDSTTFINNGYAQYVPSMQRMPLPPANLRTRGTACSLSRLHRPEEP